MSRMPLFLVLLAIPSAAEAAETVYDAVVYGGTSGGVAAAIQTARSGKSVVLIEPGQHLGGLTTGGLGATDIGNKRAIGGIAREFYGRVYRHYTHDSAWTRETRDKYRARSGHAIDADTMWTFEPHVAEEIIRTMLEEAKVPVVLGQRLDLKSGVRKQGPRIVAVTMESGRRFAGRTFIDATYEGDLMAEAGVSFSVGREANATYGETLNGVQTRHAVSHQFIKAVDPYVTPGEAASGLLPGVHAGGPGEEGQAANAAIEPCSRQGPQHLAGRRFEDHYLVVVQSNRQGGIIGKPRQLRRYGIRSKDLVRIFGGRRPQENLLFGSGQGLPVRRPGGTAETTVAVKRLFARLPRIPDASAHVVQPPPGYG